MHRSVLLAVISSVASVWPVFASDLPSQASASIGQSIDRLSHASPKVRDEAAAFLDQSSQRVFDVMRDPYNVEDNAAIAQLRRDAKPRVPQLIVALRSEETKVRSAATAVLAALGPDARAALPLLRTRALDPAVRPEDKIEILVALIYVTPAHESVCQLLLSITNSAPADQNKPIEGADGFEWAAVANGTFFLTRMLFNANRTTVEVPILAAASRKHNPPAVRTFAISMLAQMGPEARQAIPTLRSLLVDENVSIRVSAGAALLHVENDPRVVPDFVRTMRLNDQMRKAFEQSARDHFSQQATELAELREFGGEFVPFLVNRMRIAKGAHLRKVIDYLGKIGPAASDAIPDIVTASRNSDTETRARVMMALQQIDPKAAAKLSSEERRCTQTRRRPRLFRYR
jgi:HEAT repeat protein